jgi:hypothetical protein
MKIKFNPSVWFQKKQQDIRHYFYCQIIARLIQIKKKYLDALLINWKTLNIFFRTTAWNETSLAWLFPYKGVYGEPTHFPT